MSFEKKKIVVMEPDVRAMREMELMLASHFTVSATFQVDRTLAALRADRDVKAVVIGATKGTDVLSTLAAIRSEFPSVLRILLTGFEDLALVVEGLHSGMVQRVLSKPLQFAELLGMLRSGDMPGYGSTAIAS
jgi:DNA-binding NtrC family response regulator